jgi:translation initiation factor IF-1
MEKEKAKIEKDGTVTQVLSHCMFQIELENGRLVSAHIIGKLRLRYIKILEGDRVIVEMSPYDLTRGKVVHKYT